MKGVITEGIELSHDEFKKLYFSKYPIPFNEEVQTWRCLITCGENKKSWWMGFYGAEDKILFSPIVNQEVVMQTVKPRPVRKEFNGIPADEREFLMNVANEYLGTCMINTHTLADFIYGVFNEMFDIKFVSKYS